MCPKKQSPRDSGHRIADAGRNQRVFFAIVPQHRASRRYAGGMSIREDLAAELKEALRASDRNRKDVIRAIETEVSRAKAEPGFEGDVNDDLYRTVIGSYVKKMSKAREEYEGLGDQGAEMAGKLRFEIEYLSRWLPQLLDETATR